MKLLPAVKSARKAFNSVIYRPEKDGKWKLDKEKSTGCKDIGVIVDANTFVVLPPNTEARYGDSVFRNVDGHFKTSYCDDHNSMRPYGEDGC